MQTKNLQRGKQDVPTNTGRTMKTICLARKRGRGPNRHPLRIPYQLYPPIFLARRRQAVCTRTSIGYRKGRILKVQKNYTIDEEARAVLPCRISQTLRNSKRTTTVSKIRIAVRHPNECQIAHIYVAERETDMENPGWGSKIRLISERGDLLHLCHIPRGHRFQTNNGAAL